MADKIAGIMANGYLRAPITGMRCPFCSCDDGSILYRVTSQQAATHFVSPSVDKVRNARLQTVVERLWDAPSCQLIECSSCLGVWSSPHVSGDSEFYQILYEKQHAGSYPSDRWEYKESLRLCSALDGGSLESQTILEIGAGDGAFVKKVIEAGAAQPSITVLEYSDHGKNTIRAKYPGVHVRDGEDMALLPHSHFSHVFLFQVLEHLGNLNSFLSQLHRILKPNGLAFISVPNPLQVEFNELNKLLLDMPPNHISRFTEGAIHPLSARAGLSLELLTDEGFSWKSQISGYLSSRYMRLGQSRLSFPSLIDHCLDGAVRRMAAGLFVLIFLPEALLKLSSLSPRGIGGSRLIVLRKRNNGLL